MTVVKSLAGGPIIAAHDRSWQRLSEKPAQTSFALDEKLCQPASWRVRRLGSTLRKCLANNTGKGRGYETSSWSEPIGKSIRRGGICVPHGRGGHRGGSARPHASGTAERAGPPTTTHHVRPTFAANISRVPAGDNDLHQHISRRNRATRATAIRITAPRSRPRSTGTEISQLHDQLAELHHLYRGRVA